MSYIIQEVISALIHCIRVRWGEFANGNHRTIEKILSRASAGCIAAMDAINPRVTVPGQEPWSGVELKVRWPRVIGNVPVAEMRS